MDSADMMSIAATIVINLARDFDRLAHMQKEIGAAGLHLERFEAIRGDAIPPDISALFDRKITRLLSPGELGCYASHLAICKRIASGEIPSPALVFEDDVRLAPDFADIMQRTLSALPADWDLVRLSNNPKHACLNQAELVGDRHLVRYSNVPGSAGAILWNRSGAKKFLRPPLRLLPVDQDLRRVWIWQLNTFGVSPAPIERDIFDVSSIDSFAAPGWRRKQARVNLVRHQRALEMGLRHLYGANQFGLARWLRAEWANLKSVFLKKSARGNFLNAQSARISS
jgi:GR25 family glycosyltransferase involved in LPS biosynthesis